MTTSATPSRIDQIASLETAPNLTVEEMEELETVGRKIYTRKNHVSGHVPQAKPTEPWQEHMTTDFPIPDLPREL